MTSSIATLNTFSRQLYSPICGRSSVEEYAANHRNDFTKKLSYVGDIWNAICDRIEWLFTKDYSWEEFRGSEASRGGLDDKNLSDKRVDLARMNDMILVPLLKNKNKKTFVIDCNDPLTCKKLHFTQSDKDAWISDVEIEQWEKDVDGHYHIVDSIIILGKNFLDLYVALESKLNTDFDGSRYDNDKRIIDYEI
jgi:hypothetical protein